MKWIIRLAVLLVAISVVNADIVYTEPTNLPPVAADAVMADTNGVVTWPPNFKQTNDLASAGTLSNLVIQVQALIAAWSATNAVYDLRLSILETNQIPLSRLPLTNSWTNALMQLMSPDGTNLYWVQP